ncbi:MAG: hypothetical protein DMF72_05420 [Acidobacteria bacterium]|nr:MAG: hypothetical protein DMF72_05420 [Acidobacteriota bacterium]
MKNIASIFAILFCCVVSVFAQQPTEQRAALTEPAMGFDAKSSPAIEARLLTTVLNGSQDSPVTNIRVAIKNTTTNFYTYVTGWATFYDAGGTRCGEGLFKLDALAPQESAETDTPGLRLRCSPSTWRIVATNLLTRTADIAKPTEVAPSAAPPQIVVDRTPPVNFIISIDGEEHPIQVNNPVVLKLGNRNRKIVLKSAQ